MLRTLVDGGINWNWYLQGEFDDTLKTVTILFHQRWHKYDDPRHPLAAGTFRIIEKDGDLNRIADKVRVGNTYYTVTNPANIFDYRDMSQLVLEDG